MLIQSTVKRGSYTRGRCLAVHYLATDEKGQPPRVALAVGKPVGTAVVRHRVSRRIRHVMAARIDQLPDGSYLVVRALPAAATATSEALASDLDVVVPKVLRGCQRRSADRG